MKKKFSIISLSFSLLVLGAIFLQSFHTFHHLEQFVSAQHCNHKYTPNKSEINHTHKGFEHCFVCEFAFSTSLKVDIVSFEFKKIAIPVSCKLFFTQEIHQPFPGSLFALRAPPSV